MPVTLLAVLGAVLWAVGAATTGCATAAAVIWALAACRKPA